MFVVKDDDGKSDHKSYKSIYFNYFLICTNRVKLFLAMQVRVMAAYMESQNNIRSAQSRPRGRRGISDVCVDALTFLFYPVVNYIFSFLYLLHCSFVAHL